jgi:hypothetical protein
MQAVKLGYQLINRLELDGSNMNTSVIGSCPPSGELAVQCFTKMTGVSPKYQARDLERCQRLYVYTLLH